ncbi:formate dehydrogenase accessory protein FdhE [Pseudodesulfovibrio piezophilus]|uniref:Putative Formate dehydrogenase accessory protein n=1 Tax=Pseudodesulfovibrio piezophilus (strain DSM 21447 / JCM 15486 / C1TLV30) TaxID=1322246 RepID=M1WPL6_PSEP2|nr:formate dehydrogenase accessory protein FdhE [Pseudodesulfovibrio piezophilus]CCH48434.1 putative Formate dehydrogenase accessory protein [Pseudodesulfovibrio piezophilus C1TLV30]
METTSPMKQIQSTLETVRTRDSAYSEMTNHFALLFEEKEKVRNELLATTLQTLDIGDTDMREGIHLLKKRTLSPWTDAFKYAANRLLPVLAEVLQQEKETDKKIQAHLMDTQNILKLTQARVNDSMKEFENTAEELSIPSSILSYYIESISSPVFCAVVSSLQKSLSTQTWEYGHCPVCDSSPTISQLSPNTSSSEYLVGGGGKKYLHCSLCGHDWHYKRNACAACGNEDSETREILSPDEMKRERIEVCHKCDRYMLTIDMRECASLPHLDTLQMGLIHLDIIAQERALTPIAQTLWNTIR